MSRGVLSRIERRLSGTLVGNLLVKAAGRLPQPRSRRGRRDPDRNDPVAVTRQVRRQFAGLETSKQVIVDSEPLPRTPTGKVQKFLLVERCPGRA